MIRTIIMPENQEVSIHVPESFIGKQIEVLMYDIDELKQDETQQKQKASEFRGKLNLSDDQYKDFQSYLKDARNEWERDI
ncbi:MAG: hypothetical protein ACHQHN_02530 [Sphingobacteriales bacterium]